MSKKQPQKAQPAPLKAAEVLPQGDIYTAEIWKGVKTVFKCAECGRFMDLQDDMILHVLTHIPADKQEAVFQTLMENK